jgi:hypothetical protein
MRRWRRRRSWRRELARGGRGGLEPRLVARLLVGGRGREREGAAAGGAGVVEGERPVERDDVAGERGVPRVAPSVVTDARGRAGRHGL